MNTPILTAEQLALVLQINERTIHLLAEKGHIPHTYFQTHAGSSIAVFDPQEIIAWLYKGPVYAMENMNEYLLALKKQFEEQFPEAIKALKELDSRIAPPKKGFSLVKVPNKQHGFLYYVRYLEKGGKLVPSRWNTHTNDLPLAELFAKENRDRLLSEYYAKKWRKNELYTVLEAYYQKDSAYLLVDKQRGRRIGVKDQSIYRNFIIKVFIPFLKEERVQSFEDITPQVIARLQNKLLGEGIKPQSINRYLNGISAVFKQLVQTGVISVNVFKLAESLSVKEEDAEARGCHDLPTLKGVFNKAWEDPLSYLLCLIIYTTGMRNSEIEKIQAKDIVEIGKVRFIDIPKSKTKSGIRVVPLHPFVYEKLREYIEESGKQAEDYLFTKQGESMQSSVYRKANTDLGAMLGMSGADLEGQNITFYSGRHYWKTLMNAGNLGDIEEYFMGHKVSSDVSKRYNHRDKQGMERILEKAREVFKILDARLFTLNKADISQNEKQNEQEG